MAGESSVRTPYGVHCNDDHGIGPCKDGEIIYLTEREYNRQMSRPDALWKCPECGGNAWWDDENYDTFHNEKVCPNCKGTGYDHGIKCVCQE